MNYNHYVIINLTTRFYLYTTALSKKLLYKTIINTYLIYNQPLNALCFIFFCFLGYIIYQILPK